MAGRKVGLCSSEIPQSLPDFIPSKSLLVAIYYMWRRGRKLIVDTTSHQAESANLLPLQVARNHSDHYPDAKETGKRKIYIDLSPAVNKERK